MHVVAVCTVLFVLIVMSVTAVSCVSSSRVWGARQSDSCGLWGAPWGVQGRARGGGALRAGARALSPRCSQTLGCDASKHILAVRSSRTHERDRADTQIGTIRCARNDVVHAAWERDSALS